MSTTQHLAMFRFEVDALRKNWIICKESGFLFLGVLF
jgi:hypothetical protein